MPDHPRLHKGDSIGLIACSDGIVPDSRWKVDELTAVLTRFGLQVTVAPTFFSRDDYFSGTPKERGAALNLFFADTTIKAILDISGGESANQILPFIDFEIVRNNPKPFFGMSDLSVVLNALFQRVGLTTYHYQAMNMVLAQHETHQAMFCRTFFAGGGDLFQTRLEWIRGGQMEGIVIGGNIRCFLKLAGTPYIPNFQDKILFLESLGGRANRIVSLLAQLDQLGAFSRCAGILLGVFSELEKQNELPIVFEYLETMTKERDIPIAKTDELGHGSGCKCIQIGGFLSL